MPDRISTALRSRDARRALAAFDAIAAGAARPQAFVSVALDGLAGLIGSDLTTLSLCDLEHQTRTVIGRPGEALSEQDRAAFDRHFRDHPLVRYHSAHPAGRTQRLTDCISMHELRHSAVFADYYRRIGIRHAMALPLRIDAATVVSVVFNRSGADFSDADRAVIDSLRPPLAALYRSVMAREEARLGRAALRALAARAGWHTARMTGDGRLLDLSAEAARMLRHFFRDAPAGGSGAAPAELRQWLHRRSVNWGLDWLHPDAGAPLTATRGGRRLTVHFLADALAPDSGELALLQESVALAPPDLAVLPLTGREREVLAMLASGKTNAGIAALLGISPRTVQKHLEHVFEKLGVETRVAAAARAFAAAAELR